MKLLARVVLLALVTLLLTPEKSDAQSAKYCKVKFRETGVRISQYNDGYFQGYYSLFRSTNLGYMPTFVEYQFSTGYSPWRNAFSFEVTPRLVLMILTIGVDGGYSTSTDFKRGQLFIKPEGGLNLGVVQFYYSYGLVTGDYNLYSAEHNVTIAFPVVSTTHFGSCRITKRWRKLGVIHAVFEGETWQIYE